MGNFEIKKKSSKRLVKGGVFLIDFMALLFVKPFFVDVGPFLNFLEKLLVGHPQSPSKTTRS